MCQGLKTGDAEKLELYEYIKLIKIKLVPTSFVSGTQRAAT